MFLTDDDLFVLTGYPIGEFDPTARKPGKPCAKLDAGKVRPDQILDGFGLALLEVAKVATYGAGKYSENGWQEVPDGIMRYRETNDTDTDTGIAHLAHEAWNSLAELELVLRGDHVPER
jgi:hypothetical protein